MKDDCKTCLLPCGEVTVDPAINDLTFPSGSTTRNCTGSCCKKSVLVDAQERRVIENAFPLVLQAMDPEQPRDPSRWFDRRLYRDKDFPSGEAFSTAQGPFGCVFLNRRGRCVLQIVEQRTASKIALKPFYCRLYPLTVDRGALRFDERPFLKTQRCCIPDPKGPRSIREVCRDELALLSAHAGSPNPGSKPTHEDD